MREAQVRFVTKTRKLTKLPTLHELKDRHAGMKCRKITFPYPSYSSSRERSLRTVFDDGQPFPFLHFQLWFLGGLSVYHELMIITVLAAKTDLLRFEVVDGIRAVFKWLLKVIASLRLLRWLKNLAPVFQPTICKTKTDRTLYTQFSHALRKLQEELLLVHLSVCSRWDWFFDKHLKTSPTLVISFSYHLLWFRCYSSQGTQASWVHLKTESK